MKDNTTRRNVDNDSTLQDPNKGHSNEEANQSIRGDVGNQRKGSGDLGDSSGLDEKSSGMGRRDKGTGLASKDGVTGSDYDGQVSE